ncbi:MAG: hypothetical protein HN576_00240 [Bacteriovoracaceae bacterium]|jgi:hypothetical protein|nr:hypothetical protein [Bacteriovoracaceae bacterium]
MKILTLLITLLSFTISNFSCAKSGTYEGINYTIEPVYGRQEVSIEKNSESLVTESYFGARITAFYKLLNLEGMYTRSDRGEFFSKDSGKTEGYSIERLKVGIQGSYNVLPSLTGIIRLGGDIKKVKEYTYIGTELVEQDNDPNFGPYFGLGIEFGIKIISLTAGITTVFKGLPDDFLDNDYQYTLGFKLRI